MPEAYIVDAVRTPVGKKKGGLADAHPADLGAHVLLELVDRTGIDPAAVEDVVFGCLDQIGPQAGDIARTAWLAAGLPEEVPGTTIDRQCGSSQQAMHFAAQGVMSGTQDVVVAGGVQNMSTIPIAAAMYAASAVGYNQDPFSGSKGWQKRYGDAEISQFRGAELIADKWDITREDMEVFALESHRRAIRAIDEGRFDNEISPYGDVKHDEGPRRDTSLEKLAGLKPVTEGGTITAGVSSQISDGACAMLVVSEQALKTHGLRPRARIHHLSVRGADPVFMLTGPIPATQVRAGEDRAHDRRHRPHRDQRGVRVRRARLAEGDRRRPRQGQRQRRCDRARSPPRRHRRAADDDAAERARAHRRPLRPADHVRRRRPGQRHHHRTPG